MVRAAVVVLAVSGSFDFAQDDRFVGDRREAGPCRDDKRKTVGQWMARVIYQEKL